MSLSATNGTSVEPATAPSVNGTTRVPASSFRGVWPIEYPDSDGKPMSDNTKQARWIAMLWGNLEAIFRDRADVFLAADLMWYAVEGEPDEHAPPDVMLAFGRPKGDRGSYKQWEENDTPATVVFEILSPKNTKAELDEKLVWYDEHGVEEYYVYDPDGNSLEIYQRGRATLARVRRIAGYVSRRMGIRFEMTTPEMTVYRPTGERFLSFEDLDAEREADHKRAEDEKRRADEAERRVTALRGRFAELAQKIQSGQATPDEAAEFARLSTPDAF